MQKTWAFGAYMAMCTTAAHANLYSTNQSLPACAAQYIVELSFILSNVTANYTHICMSEVLRDRLRQCISAHCTIKELLRTKNITQEICRQPLRDRTKTVSITAVAGVSLAFVAFALRLLARVMTGQYGMDDWTMIVAMGFVVPLSAMAVVLADRGLGKDIWSIPFDNITYILYIYYFDEVLYLGSLMMIRVSILCFYLRIFPQRTFRRTVYVIIGSNIVYGTAFILISIFQCIPVHAAWTGWDGTVRARCVDVNALGWTSGAINIAFDVLVLLLPLPGLTKLVMPRGRKIHILLIFSLGSFVAIVSILRLTSLVKFANTQNITWDYVPVGYWSTIEVHVSVICACLPALPSLFRRKPPAAIVQNGPTGGSRTQTPKNRDSDVLPLLKVVSEHQRVSGTEITSRDIELARCSDV